MSITQNFATTQSLPFVAWLETQVTPAEFGTLQQSQDLAEALTQGAIDRGDLNITADAQGATRCATQQWASQEALDQFQAQRDAIPGIQQLNQYLAQYWS